MPSVSRAPNIPRKIRNIKPKRQLPRNERTNDRDDDWWHNNIGAAQKSSSTPGGAHLRAVAAANESFGTRSRFSRSKVSDASISQDSLENENENDTNRTNNSSLLIQMWEKFKSTPTRKKIKRFIAGMVLFTALKSIYFADLDDYQYSQKGLSAHTTNTQPSLSTKKTNSGLSALRSNTGGVKSLSELLGDDYLGEKSESSTKTMGGELEQNNKITGKSMSESIGIDSFNSSGGKSMSDSFGSSNNNNGNSIHSFGGKSMLGSFGSASGQSNFGSSNNNNGNSMQSFGGKSMSDMSFGSAGQSNFGSSNNNNGNSMQSFGGKSMSDSFGSSAGQSNFGSSNNNNGNSMQSFGGKSMPDSFGSAGQTNFGSSNNNNDNSMQSFGGKSMPDSFGSAGQSNFGSSNNNNGNNMQSASFNHLQSASFNSYSSRPEDNKQSSFHSYPDPHQQTKTSLQQLPNLSIAQDSTGQLFQGLRGQSMGKSMASSSGSGVLNHDQFFNVKNPMSNRQSNSIAEEIHTGLQCASYGGPHSEAEYSELIYWQDFPSDATFTSSYYNPHERTKYLTFEMDGSGWNNIRLGFENMILLAHSMGRTLVIPPKRQIAHGMPDIHGSKIISFDDFYDIKAINAKQNGLNIISMKDFLERESVSGNLKSMTTGEVIYPPNNQVDWNNQRLEPLLSYIRIISRTFNWNPKDCVLAFSAKGTDDQHLFSMMADVLIEKDGRPFPDYSEFQGKPVNVDGPTQERLREVLAGRRNICMYDSKMHAANNVVHFKAEENEERLILPFYAFMFWEDWRQQLFAMRFVRDNLVYNDAIFCLAARMVNTLRDYVRQRSPENAEGLYDAIHIRRRDFQSQFPMTEMSANTILAGIQDDIHPGSTIYISTDERDPTFFEPLRQVYDLKFIGDFGDMLKGVNPQLFGLAEQIVASRSRVFFGTYYSSFSAYIARLRGYYSVKENQPGHTSGALQNTYYLPSKWKREMSIYQAVHVPFYAREFPIAWRDIDKL